MPRLFILLLTCSLLSAAVTIRDEAGVINAADGAAIVTYAARIPTLGPKAAAPGLIVALHGINGNERQLIDACKLSLQAANREDAYVVLGLKSTGNGWEQVDHEPIRQAVAWAIATHHVDPRRVFAWGYSHGAIRLGHFAAEAQELFAGAVLWAGTCNKIPDDAAGLSYYVVHGESDPTVKPDNIRSARDRMRDRGIRIVYREYTDGDHGAPFSPPARAIWPDHIAWMDALRNRCQPPDAKTSTLIAKANTELDTDGKLANATSKALFPALLEAAGAPAEALVIRCLGSPTTTLRRSAATVCAHRLFGDPVVAALLPLREDADRETRTQALQALGMAADFQIAAAQEALCSMVREQKNAALRGAALQALLPAMRNQKGTVAFDPPFAELIIALGVHANPAMQKILAELTGK